MPDDWFRLQSKSFPKPEFVTKGLSIDFDIDKTDESVRELKSLNRSAIDYRPYFFSYVNVILKKKKFLWMICRF